MDSNKTTQHEDKSSWESLILDEASIASLPESNDKSKGPEARAVVV